MRWIFLWLLTSFTNLCYSQHLQNNSDVLFAFEVKQIDEFIERFNNQETLIKDYIHEKDPHAIITRTDILKSLINQADTSWNVQLVNEFISKVNDSRKPVFLNFLDPDWYAQVECSVKYLNKDYKLTLMLKVETDQAMSCKWVIAGAKADFLCLPNDPDHSAFLNPVSQGTDFMALDRILSDKRNIRNFLPEGYKEDEMSIFVDHWKSGKITFRQVDKISYHFLQVEGWIFKVENFKRNSRNAGWLISTISKAEKLQKQIYKTSVLHVN